MTDIFRFYQTRYKFLIPYAAILLIALFLRVTPANACSVTTADDPCFGQIDFFLLILSLPGWLAWLSLNLLPELVKFALMENLVSGLNVLTVTFNHIFLPSSFLLTGIILFIAGFISEKTTTPPISDNTDNGYLNL